MNNPAKAKKFNKENIAKLLFTATGLASIFAVALICIFLFNNGMIAINKIGFINFIAGKVWKPTEQVFGILPMIIASFFVTICAILIGLPVAISSAMYMAFFCNSKVYSFLKPLISLLAGIPSVVYGFWGIKVLAPFIGKLSGTNGKNALTASILLAIMILPIIIQISESSLKAVPRKYYEAARALGSSHERVAFTVMLPAAKSGVFSATILGIGRAIGETLAVVWVAGNQARMPQGLLKGLRTLTANVVLEMGYASDLHREALIATGLVLFVFILLINIIFNFIKLRITK